ncbi:MAG: DUF748 domain-containing protein [Bacteroidales bacterium]|nr:DUF748 domain-containing protein [Bacteroidales bacterium]
MYGIDNFYLNNLFFNYIVYDSLSNNISEAMVSKDNEEKLTDEADTVAAIPLSLSIKKLLVENSAITYNDESLKDPFSFCISDLKIAADNFNSETTGALTLDALAGNGGNLHAKWDGSLNDNSNQYLMVSLKNIALKDLSPYSCSLFGYPISSGTLSFIDESTIRDNIIESTNNLDIFNLRVDEARKDIKPQIKNIPFKTALYLVRDVNNHIKLDVPVKGDLSSPKFSYKKALIKTLSNVLLKITISPFAIIANSMGMGDLNLEEMDIIFSDDQLNPEHTEVLTALATILKDQPNLTLTLENKINLNKDTKTLALNILKEDYYLACNPTKTAKTLSTLDIKNINAIKDSDKQFVAFANSLCSEKKKVKIDEQAVFIYNADSLEVRLLNIAAARNSNINKFLIESQSVPSERFLIKEINIEDLRNYKGKDKIITGTEEISAPVTDISAENDSIVPLI